MSTTASRKADQIATGWRKWDAWWRCELPRTYGGGYLLVTRLQRDTSKGDHRWCWGWRDRFGALLASGPSDPSRSPILDVEVAKAQAVAFVLAEWERRRTLKPERGPRRVDPVGVVGPQDARLIA